METIRILGLYLLAFLAGGGVAIAACALFNSVILAMAKKSGESSGGAGIILLILLFWELWIPFAAGTLAGLILAAARGELLYGIPTVAVCCLALWKFLFRTRKAKRLPNSAG